MTGSSSAMLAGRPVRICRDASSTTAPAIANASCGEAKRGCGAALVVAAVELVDVLRDGVQRAVAAGHRARARADDLHQQRLRLVGELLERAQERLGGRAHALGGLGVDAALARGAHRAQDHLDGGVEQGDDAVLLVVEVLVEGGLRHAGLARDRLRGRLAVADAREHGGGRREQAAALLVLPDLERRSVPAAGDGASRCEMTRAKGSQRRGHYPLARMRRPLSLLALLLATASLAGCTAANQNASAGDFEGAERDVAAGDRRPQGLARPRGDLLAALHRRVRASRSRRTASDCVDEVAGDDPRRRQHRHGRRRRHGHRHDARPRRSARTTRRPRSSSSAATTAGRSARSASARRRGASRASARTGARSTRGSRRSGSAPTRRCCRGTTRRSA